MKTQSLALSALLVVCGMYSCNEQGTAESSAQKFIETANMDSSVRPGDNFYSFVNGKWIKENEIPSTETNIGAFLDLYNRTKENLKLILAEVSKGGQKQGSIEQQVGDFYASGMDSATIEKLGYDPVKPYLQKVAAFTDAKSIMRFEAESQTENDNYIAAMYVAPDDKNSSMNIASFVQTGLGLPDRDYYFKTDASTVAIQQAYQAYMKKVFMLTGDDSVTAAKKVADVYALEKKMAESHRTNVQLRDPESNYHKMPVAALDKQMPVFGWAALLNTMGIKVDSVNVAQPEYYNKLEELLKTIPVDTWKAYYSFHIINNSAPALSSAFVNARFDYVGKALSGQQQIKPRWERIYRATDNNLGEPLGHLYVKRYFTEEAKNRMMGLIDNLGKAFEIRIDALDWMSDSTKQVSKDKLHAFLKQIGYPDNWRDYSKVTIDRNTYFKNLVECAKNEYQYQTGKIGKAVDRAEWDMTPPTINAGYYPNFNKIVFPAGILQFPFFDPKADDAINYGGIGMVIGHEMTHGFDDQGAQYDKEGNLKNWWGKEDNEKFKVKSKQVIDLYNTFTILDSVHINGELTTGENMADIGGIAIAYDAFKMTKQGQDTTKIDGFTPDQRFFISFAQIWRDKTKDESLMLQVSTDPHSPAEYRVNGPLQNFTPFYTAFNIKEGDKMFIPADKRIKIW